MSDAIKVSGEWLAGLGVVASGIALCVCAAVVLALTSWFFSDYGREARSFLFALVAVVTLMACATYGVWWLGHQAVQMLPA